MGIGVCNEIKNMQAEITNHLEESKEINPKNKNISKSEAKE